MSPGAAQQHQGLATPRPPPRTPFGLGARAMRQLPTPADAHATQMHRFSGEPLQSAGQASILPQGTTNQAAAWSRPLGLAGWSQHGWTGHSTQQHMPMLPLAGEAAYRDQANDPRQARRRRRRPSPTRGFVLAPLAPGNSAATMQPPAPPAMQAQAAQQQHQHFLLGFAQPGSADSGTQRLWVCIHQLEPGGPADVFLHDAPVDEESGLKLPAALAQQPLMTVYNSSFTRCPLISGTWHNYPIQFRGDFFLQHEQIEWPNEIRLFEPCTATAPTGSASNILPYGSTAANMVGYAQGSAWLQRASRATSPTASSSSASQGPVSSSSHTHMALSTTPSQRGTARYSHQLQALPNAASSGSGGGPGCYSGWAVQRSKVNYAGLDDIVVWLCDPTPERVVAHLANMVRSTNTSSSTASSGIVNISSSGSSCGSDGSSGSSRAANSASRRRRVRESTPKSSSPEVVYGRLASRWGSHALVDMGFTRRKVMELVQDAAHMVLPASTCPRPPMSCMYLDSLDADVQAHARQQALH